MDNIGFIVPLIDKKIPMPKLQKAAWEDYHTMCPQPIAASKQL